MNPCLYNLVGISSCDHETDAYIDLMRAPEITTKALAKTANDKYKTGRKLAEKNIEYAEEDIIDELVGFLRQNNMIADITEVDHNTSEYDTQTILPPFGVGDAGRRGITLRKVRRRGSKTLNIKRVQVYSASTLDTAEIHIIDLGKRYTYPFPLVANQVTDIEINYRVLGEAASILIYAPGAEVYSSELICLEGCHGATPNDCAFARSNNGIKEDRSKEGYGLNIIFECSCDFESLFCDFAKTHVARLIYLKARKLLLDERIVSDRLNDFIVLAKDEAIAMRSEVIAEYNAKYEDLITQIPIYLSKKTSDCITCRGSKWVANG